MRQLVVLLLKCEMLHLIEVFHVTLRDICRWRARQLVVQVFLRTYMHISIVITYIFRCEIKYILL